MAADGSGPLTLDLPGDEGEEALAVFSFEEEALLYLRIRASGSCWCVEKVEAEELVSMLLCEACSGVGWVALDPMAEVCAREAVGLMGMSREEFLDRLLLKTSSMLGARYLSDDRSISERQGEV